MQPLPDNFFLPENGVSRIRNRVKSAAATHEVPVHPVLVRLGLIKYIAATGGAPDDLVFPELRYDPRMGYSREVSRWFTTFRRGICIVSAKTTFHSLRHTIRTMLRAVGVASDLIDELIGHEDRAPRGVGAIYEKGVWRRRSYEAISKLAYDIQAFGEADAMVERLRGG